eukprot:8589747-Alexandrium_andersonii.AAC.1
MLLHTCLSLADPRGRQRVAELVHSPLPLNDKHGDLRVGPPSGTPSEELDAIVPRAQDSKCKALLGG